MIRILLEKRRPPTAAAFGRQTVRCDLHGGGGDYAASKKTKGRNRFLSVETLGLVLAARGGTSQHA